MSDAVGKGEDAAGAFAGAEHAIAVTGKSDRAARGKRTPANLLACPATRQ
jgi:hypothetical protein